MKKNPILQFIMFFYALIGGVSLGFSIIGIYSFWVHDLKNYFLNIFIKYILEHTVISIQFLNSFHFNIIIYIGITLSIIISIFHTLLAQALFLDHSMAYMVGIFYHISSALSSIFLWIIGQHTLKFIGFFLLFLNLMKGAFLYQNRK